jgi:hypothetical protein
MDELDGYMHIPLGELLIPGPSRLIAPILAIFSVDGETQASTVPIGTVVDLNGKMIDGDRFVEALWNGRLVIMFTDDLRTKAVPQ